MRARRRRLSAAEQAAATSAIARVVGCSRLLRPGRRIAVYHRQGSEADLAEVIALARRLRCLLYLPVITHRRYSRMEFVRFDAHTSLRPNSLGILEPRRDSAGRICVRELDAILMPLVAFDERGWRLGSGAGFYDRRLQHLKAGRRWRRPKLIGIAYEFQRVPRLAAQPWDVPLDAVITERRMYRITQPSRSMAP
jgi:5-formyltetrahydrofolate cyclo-ligase